MEEEQFPDHYMFQLNSERAVQVSIALVDVFVKLRDHLSDPLEDVFKRLHQIEDSGVPKRRKKIGL